MDLNEQTFKNEVSSFVASLHKLLPKKKDFIVIEPERPKPRRLVDVHIEAKSVFPLCFIGTKLVVLREILDKVKLVQQYNFGRPKESYRCFTDLIAKETEPKPSHDGLVLDWTGSATASYRETIDGGYEMRLVSKIRDLISSENEIVLEKSNESSVGSVTCTMRDVDPNTIRVISHFIYKLLPEIYIGTELGVRPLAYPPNPELSVSARYEKPTFTLSSTLSRLGFQVCLFKKLSSNLRIASIINESSKAPTTVGIALHKTYLNGCDVKIFVDSQRCGGFTLQKDVLLQEPQNEIRVLRLVASTLIDRQRRVRFGFGFNLDF